MWCMMETEDKIKEWAMNSVILFTLVVLCINIMMILIYPFYWLFGRNTKNKGGSKC